MALKNVQHINLETYDFNVKCLQYLMNFNGLTMLNDTQV